MGATPWKFESSPRHHFWPLYSFLPKATIVATLILTQPYTDRSTLTLLTLTLCIALLLACVGWVKAVRALKQERHRSNAFHKQVQLQEKAIKAAHVGTFIYDVRQDKTLWDERSKAIFGHPDISDELPPMFWENCIAEADRPRIIQNCVDTLSNHGSLMDHEYRIRWPDGSEHWVKGSAYVVRNVAGEPLQMIGFHFDITPFKQVEQNLIAEKQQALAGSRAKTEFIANISHEIRTPMSAMSGILQLLSDTALNSTQRSYLQTLENSTQLLLTIFNDILDLSRIEEGKAKLEYRPFSLRDAIAQCLAVFTQASEQKDLLLVASIDDSLPDELLGDVARLQQIIINLLSNAFKFTEQGAISVNVEPWNNQLKFSVTDTGHGISELEQKRLFGRFEQLDHQRDQALGGAGLGLTIVKTLIDLWGGDIGVSSEIRQGSTFWFTLPIDARPHPFSATYKPTLMLTRHTVLIDKIKRYVPNQQIVCVHSEEEFKWAFQQNTYTHVITDYRVKGSTGVELLSWAKQLNPACHCTLIGFEKFVGQQRHHPAVDAFIARPFILQQLLNTQSQQTARPVTTLDAQWPQFPELKTLIVDDNQTNLIVLKGLLKRFGIDAECAQSGKEAIARCSKQPFNLIFMDYEMPGMNGIETLQQLSPCTARVVGLSAHLGTDFEAQCLAAGMSDVLSKPLSMTALENVLKNSEQNKAV